MSTFSLKKRGVLDKPWTATLIGNGAKDSQVPISDVYVAWIGAAQSSPGSARLPGMSAWEPAIHWTASIAKQSSLGSPNNLLQGTS